MYVWGKKVKGGVGMAPVAHGRQGRDRGGAGSRYWDVVLGRRAGRVLGGGSER